MEHVAHKNIINTNTKHIGIYNDNPDTTATEKLRSEACISVPADFQTFGELGFQTIPAGKYAITTHHGSYDKLHDTYRALYGKWLPESGYTPSDKPAFELYHNSPQDTAPEDLVTDIYLPLE